LPRRPRPDRGGVRRPRRHPGGRRAAVPGDVAGGDGHSAGAFGGWPGPLLTGGISSRLPAIAGPDQVSQRLAQGWDVATYGIGGTIGPGVVAAVSAWAGPTAAALILAGATFVAAAVVRLLPYVPPAAGATGVPRPVQTLRLMAATGRLRRMLYLTITVAFSRCGSPHRGRRLHRHVPGATGSRRRSDGRLRAGRPGRFGRSDVPSAAGRRGPTGDPARGDWSPRRWRWPPCPDPLRLPSPLTQPPGS
jgi:hypothetical protein